MHRLSYYLLLMIVFRCAYGFTQSPERIVRVAQHYAAKDEFSGTVTFAKSGKVTVWRSYGFSNRAERLSFNEHTRFNVGSISKQFTAAAVLLLQEDGKLKTSDRVLALLPGEKLPSAWSDITLRELLSHTSGLKDYFTQDIQAEHTPAELLDLVRDAPLKFKPGEGYDYSNTNYLLLGLVIQRVAGIPYCQFLHKRIFDRLGMRDTQCLEEPGALEHHAVGYAPVDPGEGKPLNDDQVAPMVDGLDLLGAGSIVSTGDDLVRWTDALHHGRVLSSTSYREMTTPVHNGYGYGLQIGSGRGHMHLNHSGVLHGFYSELEYYPGTDNTVAILSNQNALSKGQFTPGTHEIDSELMTLAAEPNARVPSEGKELPPPLGVLRLFEGRYVADDGKQAPFTIYLNQDHLWLLQDGPGHQASQLREDYGELDFYLADTEADLEFDGDSGATIFDLRYERAIPFHRVQEPGPAPKSN